jgi:hypothetical protein
MCTGQKYFKLVAVPINSTAVTSFNFPTDDVLKQSKIMAVEAFSLLDFTPGPGGLPVAANVVFAKAFLNLKSRIRNEDTITRLPLERLRAANNSGEPFQTCGIEINPSECTVEVASIASLVAGEQFFIGIHYQRNN